MTKKELKETKIYLILKYGSIKNAIGIWLNLPENSGHELDGCDMVEIFLAQAKKDEAA